MDDYSSQAFLLAFIRLSCEVGYPKVLLIDSGSQLTSSCENMKISYQDIKAKIYQGVQVECENSCNFTANFVCLAQTLKRGNNLCGTVASGKLVRRLLIWTQNIQMNS